MFNSALDTVLDKKVAVITVFEGMSKKASYPFKNATSNRCTKFTCKRD